jgi:hypothetical protein
MDRRAVGPCVCVCVCVHIWYGMVWYKKDIREFDIDGFYGFYVGFMWVLCGFYMCFMCVLCGFLPRILP